MSGRKSNCELLDLWAELNAAHKILFILENEVIFKKMCYFVIMWSIYVWIGQKQWWRYRNNFWWVQPCMCTKAGRRISFPQAGKLRPERENNLLKVLYLISSGSGLQHRPPTWEWFSLLYSKLLISSRTTIPDKQKLCYVQMLVLLGNVTKGRVLSALYSMGLYTLQSENGSDSHTAC